MEKERAIQILGTLVSQRGSYSEKMAWDVLKASIIKDWKERLKTEKENEQIHIQP